MWCSRAHVGDLYITKELIQAERRRESPSDGLRTPVPNEKMRKGPLASPAQVSEALEVLKHQMISSQISLNTTTGQGVLSFKLPAYFIIYFSRYCDLFFSLLLNN